MVETVTVACKIPNGMLAVIRHPSRTDTKGNLIAGAVRQSITFQGPPRPLNVAPTTFEQHHDQGGFGLTHNVPEDFWNEWYANNIDTSVVTGHFVFAQAKPGDAVKAAKDNASAISGMEPADPNKLPDGLEKLNQKD